MAGDDSIFDQAIAAAEGEIRKLRPLWQRVMHWTGVVLVLVSLLVGLLVWAVDTGPGHRLLADRIAALSPESGLRIRVGRIDGSIWSRATLRDVRFSDRRGLFLEVPELKVDWRPMAWLSNRLDVRNLSTDLAILHRVPQLRKSTAEKKAILPGFDIRLDRLHVRRLRVEPGVTGERQVALIDGRADIRDGRARIGLDLASTADDRLRLRLDAQPDRDGFDLDMRLAAPSKGMLGAFLGTDKPIRATIAGTGRWRNWRGRAEADMAGQRAVDLALTARSGHYRLTGTLALTGVTQGKLQRLSAPLIRVDGTAHMVDRRLDTELSMVSGAFALRESGVIDLSSSAYDDLSVSLRLLRPEALFPNMSGRDVQFRLHLDGPFDTAAFDYALTAPQVAFDKTGFEGVSLSGAGTLSPEPVSIPVTLTARAVTGIGDVAGGILRNLRVEGVMKFADGSLSGQGMKLASDRLKGELALAIDLATGKYEVGISGGMVRYLVPGIGLVDVKTELVVVPGANGRGSHLEGRGHAWVRRLDNALFRSLAEGLPEIHTRLTRDSDGILHFTDLRLTSPGLTLVGHGERRRDGSFLFEGQGNQRRYGPVRLHLEGPINRPRLDIGLASPMKALGLADVRLRLDPNARGYDWNAEGQSLIGPFRGDGRLLLDPGRPALVAVDALVVSGTRAAGTLRVDQGGLDGRLTTKGGGIDGTLAFSPKNGVQGLEAHLGFGRAHLGGLVDLGIGQGRLDGSFLLDPVGLTADATLNGRALRRGRLSMGRLTASIDLDAGEGEIRAGFAGSRGRAFDIKTVIGVDAGRLRISGQGSVDGQPIRLDDPAEITHDAAGWHLDTTSLDYAGGRARLSGRIGPDAVEVEAAVSRLPLAILDILAPDLGFGGHASGHLSYRLPRGGRLPVGEADLSIRGLTRSGLVLSSRPIDLAIKAKLTETILGARAVATSEGKLIGRAQARIGTLSASGNLIERLTRAPVSAQLRYNGPADTLWRLSRLETIDLSGPVTVSADIGGTLDKPAIRGALRSSGARLESAISGTVIEKIEASGRFDGSLLQIDRFSGGARGGGTVTGSGRFDLAAVNGFGMDLQIDAQQALLLNRDDIAATVTGPLRIRSDGAGGVISGDLRVSKARFRLGRAAAVEVPRLNVTELNRIGDDDDRTPAKPWELAIKAEIPNRLTVTGLGLDSEWRADLDIRGRPDMPAITGRADLVRGDYEFAGRRFELERGTIRFLGQAPPDPALDIAASANVQGLNATIRVTGTGLRPDISFSSVPAMPEDELLSRLLFGTSITNLSAPEALQLASAVSSLQAGGTGLDPINAVRRAAKLDRLRILPADTTTGQGTSIAAGKYIGRRTYVELITDGQGYSATRVEFQITRWLSLLSSISTLGQQSVNVRVSKDY